MARDLADYYPDPTEEIVVSRWWHFPHIIAAGAAGLLVAIPVAVATGTLPAVASSLWFGPLLACLPIVLMLYAAKWCFGHIARPRLGLALLGALACAAVPPTLGFLSFPLLGIMIAYTIDDLRLGHYPHNGSGRVWTAILGVVGSAVVGFIILFCLDYGGGGWSDLFYGFLIICSTGCLWLPALFITWYVGRVQEGSA
jgi:hypothetical protein